MTNEITALVAIFANDALPDAPGDGNIELNYTNSAQYDRAVDVLDKLGLLTSEQVAVRTLSSGRRFERIKVGGMWLLSPVEHLAATAMLEEYAADEPAPILKLARVGTRVRHLRPLEPLAAFYSGDPGDEHHDPSAA